MPTHKPRDPSACARASDLRGTLPPSAILDAGAPQLPATQIIITLLCAIIPVAYWWYVIVPYKRRELASSKRKGDVKEYLEDLAATPSGDRQAEKWFYDKYLREAKLVEGTEAAGLPKVVQAVESELQQQLPGGGFWSFDNPIFVCLVMLAIFCTVQVATHSSQL
ncbi:LOX3.1 [Symbiodinium pilosum]|uniref:LOX3.1 protein n=1 Tax=Symbiodinium pilosum TaxID=2952 RepID=A0A812J5N6_SYMPI|nr:LOX3.1 [Symbiodinium pilosum]